MSLSSLVDIIHSKSLDRWTERNKTAFNSLFGGSTGRYKKAAESAFTVRAPGITTDSGVPFAAYIHPSNPTSGPYSGLSFVLFPVAEQACLLGLVVGTQGLAPDEAILGRPGHARKAQAICKWLNAAYGNGHLVAWAKHDPTRTDLQMPELNGWSDYKSVFDRYGKEIYAIFKPNGDLKATENALIAFLDLTFEERGFLPLSGSLASADKVKDAWQMQLLPSVSDDQIVDLLDHRRFVILQGPPGTGKTYLATRILASQYASNGRTIQFHANTTYESFIGGLSPAEGNDALAFKFVPRPGLLMEAAEAALSNPAKKYLLHIDEINRADLAKVLGEAIFLLEPNDRNRKIRLPYDFPPTFQRDFYLPENLHILGTMNSSDRSIAILDVAVRRRFGFLTLMPQFSVVQNACDIMQEAFKRLVDIFIDHAPDDAFNLMPGHSYFLETNTDRAKQSLRINLVPLLEEYLAQGYVGGFAEPIRAYLQWITIL